MIIKTKKNQSVYSYFIDILYDTAKELMTKEFKDTFDKAPVKIKFLISDSINHLWNDYIMHTERGYMSLSGVLDDIKDYRMRWGSCPIRAGWKGRIYNDKVKITSLYVALNPDNFRESIINALDNGLQYFEEYLRITMRHEMGHLMEYISFEGMSKKEIDELIDRRRIEKTAHFEKWENIKVTSDGELQRLAEYYNLEAEATANLLANVDVKRLLELDEATGELQKDHCVILNISYKQKKCD